MTRNNSLEAAVQKAVADALQQRLPELQREIAARVLGEIPAAGAASSGSNTADLLKVVASIHAAGTQRDILRTLLDGSVHYCGRNALFLVKGGNVTGWQGRGFADDLKDFALDSHSGLVARVLEERSAIAANASEMD